MHQRVASPLTVPPVQKQHLRLVPVHRYEGLFAVVLFVSSIYNLIVNFRVLLEADVEYTQSLFSFNVMKDSKTKFYIKLGWL